MGRQSCKAMNANRQTPWCPGICQRDDPDRHRAAATARRRRWYDGKANPAPHHTTDRIETGEANSKPQVSPGTGRMVVQNFLQRMASQKSDIIVIERLAKRNLAASGQ